MLFALLTLSQALGDIEPIDDNQSDASLRSDSVPDKNFVYASLSIIMALSSFIIIGGVYRSRLLTQCRQEEMEAPVDPFTGESFVMPNIVPVNPVLELSENKVNPGNYFPSEAVIDIDYRSEPEV